MAVHKRTKAHAVHGMHGFGSLAGRVGETVNWVIPSRPGLPSPAPGAVDAPETPNPDERQDTTFPSPTGRGLFRSWNGSFH
jgi:hypothetical protein